jgi:hypothetical protein
MPTTGAAAFLAASGVVGQAAAQQTVVPLERFDDRVGITVGVNGAADRLCKSTGDWTAGQGSEPVFLRAMWGGSGGTIIYNRFICVFIYKPI